MRKKVFPLNASGSEAQEVKEGRKFIFTNQEVEAALLRAKGYSLSQIGKELKLSPSDVSKKLKRFRDVAPIIYQTQKRLSKVGYFEKLRDKHKALELVMKRMEKMAQQGYHFARTTPTGYKKQDYVLVKDPKMAPIVEQLFKGRDEGKTLPQLSEETGLFHETILGILKNPVYYGKITWKGKIYPGKHEAIVSEELWRRVQPQKRQYKGTVLPFGYKSQRGRIIIDPQKASIVRQIIQLRLQGKGPTETAELLGISKKAIYHVIEKPYCAGKMKVNDKYVDVGFEPIVPFERWLRANQIKIKSTSKTMIERGIETRRKILSCLPARGCEIQKKTGYSKATIQQYLQRFKKEGMVEKGPSQYGKWYLKVGSEKS